jgi:hypothetical protein
MLISHTRNTLEETNIKKTRKDVSCYEIHTISILYITFLFQHDAFTLRGILHIYFGLMSLSHFEVQIIRLHVLWISKGIK